LVYLLQLINEIFIERKFYEYYNHFALSVKVFVDYMQLKYNLDVASQANTRSLQCFECSGQGAGGGLEAVFALARQLDDVVHHGISHRAHVRPVFNIA
jgi:hypothetical protein